MRDIASCFREFMHLDRRRARGGLSAAELARWTELGRLLAGQFSPRRPGQGPERRASVRVPVRLSVCFRDDGQLRRSLMTNLSRGGVFVETDVPPALGTRLELRLLVEESGRELVIPARVVSLDTAPDLSAPRRGMGLRFLEMSEAVQREVDALYERKFAEAAEKPGEDGA